MGLMGLIGLVGCKATKVIEQVPVYIHDTTQTVRELHDSIYIDRWHTIEVKGDTVYCHDSISFVKWLVRTDTAYVCVEKPVIVSKTETVEVEKPLTWLQKTLMGMGVVGLMGLIGLIGWRVLKRKFLPRA
jgi:hypothetical protein